MKGIGVQEVFEKIIDRLDRASDHYECEEQGREDVYMVDLEEAIEIVKEAVTEYNNGWIPCSERLPKIYEGTCTSEIVLVQGYDKEIDYEWQAMGWYAEETKQWYFAECKSTDKPINWINIIAWQQLPDPYKPKED